MAAGNLPKFFPMFMTAAGTIIPAKVLILGAGVAGLQAIATARKLGAVVEAFDVRAAVKEEVESLGAKFVEVEGAIDDKSAGGYAVEQTEEFKKKQAQVIQNHVIKSDVVICTAQIPGRKAPVLITEDTVKSMKAGSIIIDLAASTGGNCALTKDEQIVDVNRVKIYGYSNLPSDMPADASKMFTKNVINFVKLIIKEGQLDLNFEDDIVAGTCVTHNKEIYNERLKINDCKLKSIIMDNFFQFFIDNRDFIYLIILSIFLGIEVISNVPAILHTPLMSGPMPFMESLLLEPSL